MRLILSIHKNSFLYAISICFMISGTSAQQPHSGSNQLAIENHDLLLESVKLDKFSTNGALTYVLEALALKQNSSTGTSHIDQPTIEFENPEGTLWKVTARRGTLYKRQVGLVLLDETFHLTGDVEIIRSSLSDQTLKISSEHFFLFPSKNHGETMSPVIITSLNTNTTAANLSVNLRLGEIRLESSPTQNVETKVLYAQAKK